MMFINGINDLRMQLIFIMIYHDLSTTHSIYIYKSSQTSKSRLGSRRTNGFKTYENQDDLTSHHLFGIFHIFPCPSFQAPWKESSSCWV